MRKEASALVSSVNELWGVSNDGLGGGTCSDEQQIDSPALEACRLRHTEVPGHLRRSWSLIFAAASEMNAAYRESTNEAPTGELLWGVLRESVEAPILECRLRLRFKAAVGDRCVMSRTYRKWKSN